MDSIQIIADFSVYYILVYNIIIDWLCRTKPNRNPYDSDPRVDGFVAIRMNT